MAEFSDNLRMLGEYSDRMFEGDVQAVQEFWAEDFESHVTRRVNPDAHCQKGLGLVVAS